MNPLKFSGHNLVYSSPYLKRNTTKINWLMLFKEMIPVYSESHTKPISTNFSHWLLKHVVGVATTGLLNG
jgi:hypothetical protein